MGTKECLHCRGKLVKHGFSTAGVQRYRCRACCRCAQGTLSYRACTPGTSASICKLLCEGVSLRGIARLLRISLTTVIRRIRMLGKHCREPIAYLPGDEYELDELRTYVGKRSKPLWVAFALNRRTGQVISLQLGRRTKRHLQAVVETVLATNPAQVFTDKLPLYANLIPKALHATRRGGTNHIERFHLNLRQHLQRLTRRTLAFSRKRDMLAACIRIYLTNSRPIHFLNIALDAA